MVWGSCKVVTLQWAFGVNLHDVEKLYEKSYEKLWEKLCEKLCELFLMWVGGYLVCGFAVWGLVLGSFGYALVLHSGSKL